MGELAGVLLAAGRGVRFGGDKGLALLPDGMPMAVRSALNLRAVLANVICVVRPGDVMLRDLLGEHGFEVVVAEDAAQGMSASLHAGVNATPDAAGWMVALADMPLIKPETYQRLVSAFSAEKGIIVPCLVSKTPSPQPLSLTERGAKEKPNPTLLCERRGAVSKIRYLLEGLPPWQRGNEGDLRLLRHLPTERGAKEQKHRLPLALCRERGPGGEGGNGHPVTFPARYQSDLLALRGDKGAKAILQRHAADIQQVSVDDPGILQDFDTRQALERLFI